MCLGGPQPPQPPWRELGKGGVRAPKSENFLKFRVFSKSVRNVPKHGLNVFYDFQTQAKDGLGIQELTVFVMIVTHVPYNTNKNEDGHVRASSVAVFSPQIPHRKHAETGWDK